jgi:formamidopyrimidine-DNA glycosylase
MPELPEVEVVVRQLRQCLLGRSLRAPSHVHPQILERGTLRLLPRLEGARVADIRRRGKLILLELDPAPGGPLVLTLHLRMTGRLRVTATDAPVAVHTHLRVPVGPAGARSTAAPATDGAGGGEELRFSDQRRFGRVGVYRLAETGRIPLLRRLGPEPGEVDPDALKARLARRPGPIKGALLDQALIAGLGNIYVDEILFAARVHPQTPARNLDARDVAAVLAAMRRVLAAAIRLGGSTIRDYRAVSDAAGSYQRRHRVFRREGKPCPRCGVAIAKIRVAGRGTHLCPGCQIRRGRRSPGRG